MFNRIGIKRVDDEKQDSDDRGRSNQRLYSDQFGAQHLLHQRMLKIGRYRRLLVLAPAQSQHDRPWSVAALARESPAAGILHESSMRRKRVAAVVVTAWR
jgi:hypothetical protein